MAISRLLNAANSPQDWILANIACNRETSLQNSLGPTNASFLLRLLSASVESEKTDTCNSSTAFDLDPDEGSTILTCVEVAYHLREVFEQLGLKSFPKVTGSKGIQLYVPLNTAITYNATTPFAKSVAELLAKQHPTLVVSEMSKELRKKRVMIDWSQNVQATTTVAVYSMRGKRDEPFISAPLTWTELDTAAKQRDADLLYFSLDKTLQRVKNSAISLPRCSRSSRPSPTH